MTTLPAIDIKEQMEKAANDGLTAVESGKFAEAETAYSSAVAAAAEIGDIISEALFRSYRGEARRALGHADAAHSDIENALVLAQSQGALQIAAQAHFLLSELHTDAGEENKAIEQLLKALDAALACGDANIAEVSFGKLGLIYLDLGFLEAASECFRQALEQNESSDNRCAWLGNLGQSLAELGQLDESIALYRRALHEATATGNLRAQANCLASEGYSLFRQARYEAALDCFTRALVLVEQDNDPARKSKWLGNLGNVYLRLGRQAEALETIGAALNLAREVKDKYAEAAHLDSLGDCFTESGDAEKALEHYDAALQLGRDTRDRIGERVYLHNVARAHKRLGRADRAIELFREAVQIFEYQRSRIHADTLKTSFAAGGQELYRDTIETCLNSGRRIEALEYVGRAKSRAILELLRNSPIDLSDLQSGDDESVSRLIAREQDLSRQISRLERIYSHGHGGDTDADHGHRGAAAAIDDAPRLYNEWREVTDQLKRRHRNYATMVAVDTLDFSQLKALWSNSSALPEDSAVVEFFVSEAFLFGAAVWHGCSEPATKVISEPDALSALLSDIESFLEMAATEGWEVPASLCKRLYSRLIGSLCADLPQSIRRLVIVPHGILHKIPFAALHDGNGYLIERYSLSYLPTSSLIPVLRERTPASDGLSYLVSAISDYSATRDSGIAFSSRLRSAYGLDDLNFTLAEGQTVVDLAGRHVQDVRLLTNEQVKDGLLNLFGQYPVVHFAGHAVFNPDEPLASGLVLADGSVLTAARILQSNALRTNCGKLLVLSACQTGVSVVTDGGEIIGLARALMYAGMPNLILSLWEVADRSTANLMHDFHELWQGGKVSVAEALAQAQRRAASDKQPLHAWAPFVHLGVD